MTAKPLLPPAILWVSYVVCSPCLTANEPTLHERIDALVAQRAEGVMAERAADAEFLRRIYLDLVGRIPSATEAREFLANAEANKREQLIDRLLASAEHATRLRQLFHVMLMERLGDHEEWDRYLQVSFAANKPWNEMAREICSPDANSEQTRGSAFFLSKRLENYGQNPVDYPGLVRDVGRLFLGVDVQCAQCHDHLFVDDYKQVDYQGLYAFLGQAVLRQDVQFPAISENLVTKKVDFKSVFVGEEQSTGPRLPGGAEVEILTFPTGEEYATPPDKKTRFPGVPKFSPLKVLSEQLTGHPAFSRNAANRLWWMMMGRGLVHPLDLHHNGNPPSHPELLELLAAEFTSHGYDLRWLLRELALTETYQRASLLPEGTETISESSFRVAIEKPLSAEQLFASVRQAVSNGQPIADDPALKEARERFLKAFANPPREPEVDHNPTLKAALFLLNDKTLLSWLEPTGGNLVERLTALTDGQQFADELYLSILSRPPEQTERDEATEYLGAHANDRPVAVGRLVWALVASNEFYVNH